MIGQQLKEARQTLGLNIAEMAIALNTPRGTYVKWERGERRTPGIVEVALQHKKFKNSGKSRKERV